MFDFSLTNLRSPIMDRARAPAAIEFGRFSVLPHRRELLAEGQPLDLGGRAFDVLRSKLFGHGIVTTVEVFETVDRGFTLRREPRNNQGASRPDIRPGYCRALQLLHA